jgi:hypothetical protein
MRNFNKLYYKSDVFTELCTNMMSNWNKLNVPDDIKMNTARNNLTADLCETLNYTSAQIKGSLRNPHNFGPPTPQLLLILEYIIIIICIIIIIHLCTVLPL